LAAHIDVYRPCFERQFRICISGAKILRAAWEKILDRNRLTLCRTSGIYKNKTGTYQSENTVMNARVMARETVADLRRIIARIEGRLPATLQAVPTPSTAAVPGEVLEDDDGKVYGLVLRRAGHVALPGRGVSEKTVPDRIRTGAEAFDEACGGGLPLGALGEIHVIETRNAGAAAGFALGLARCAAGGGTVIWIGMRDAFDEAGFPHAPGIAETFGIAPHDLYLCTVPRAADALWVAEEAAGLKHGGCVIAEMRGEPKALGLTATRRLHRRAVLGARPVFLLRQVSCPSPTAAPWRIIAAPAPSAERALAGGTLPGSLGAPRFYVALDKAPGARGGQFTVEWNRDDQCFRQVSPAHNGAVLPASFDRPDKEAAPRQVVAFETRRRAG
jgi:protein ImuA